MGRETVLSVIALVLVWVSVDLFLKKGFHRKDADNRKRGSDLLALTFIVLLTGAVVFLAVGDWLTILFDG